jgi:mevalonate-3-phosphate-5-kinase
MYSSLLATGLNLKQISDIINNSRTDGEIEENVGLVGNKYLERYLIFKQYKELTLSQKLKEPLIPIIAAMPCVGKTTLAREVGTALGIGNVMGGDSFRAALRELVSKEEHPAFFTSVYESWKFFGEETKENILKGFQAQASIANQAIERIVADRGIRDGESIVVEYLHFLPSQFSKEVLEYPAIIPIVLRTDSVDVYKSRMQNRDRMTHFKGNVARLLAVADKYLLMQEFQCEDARKHGVPVVSTDDWDGALDRILDIIFARIRLLNNTTGIEEPEIVKKLREERRKLSDKM